MGLLIAASHHRNRASTVTTASINTNVGTVPPSVPPLPTNVAPQASISTATPPPPRLSIDTLLGEITAAVENMRHQHSSLLTLLPLSNFHNVMSSTEESSTPYESDADATEGRVSPTETTRPGGPSDNALETDTPAGSAFQTAMSMQTGHRSRGSLSSLYAEVASIYYDAEIEPYDDEETVGPRQHSHGRSGSRSSLASFEVDKHVERAMQEMEERDRQQQAGIHGAQDASARFSVDTIMEPTTPTMNNAATLATAPSSVSGPVTRRTSLPAPSPASEPSLISMLRKNVGKDLSTISFDVTFNEPLSLLQ